MYSRLKISDTTSIGPRKQKGAVLVIGMVLLLILMIGAVTMMNSSVQDEKMTGNARRSVDAFVAAEAGIEDAIDEYLDALQWYSTGLYCDKNTNILMYDPDGISSGDPAVKASEVIEINNNNYKDNSSYTVTFNDYCIADDSGVLQEVSLSSRGEQLSAVRIINIGVGHSAPSWPAVFVNDCSDDKGFNTCNFSDLDKTGTYTISGNGGASFSTNSAVCSQHINDIVSDDSTRVPDAIIHYNPAPDFTSPQGLEDFYASIMIAADYDPATGVSNNPGINIINPPIQTNVNKDPNTTVTKNDFDINLLGTLANPKTTVVHGNLDLTGGSTVASGAGVLVVTGEAIFGGTPDWEGVIIVLGGKVTNSGGGNADSGLDGTMIISSIDVGPEVENNKDELKKLYPQYRDPDTGQAIRYPNPYGDEYDVDNSFSGWGCSDTDPEVELYPQGGGNGYYEANCEVVSNAVAQLTPLLEDAESGLSGATTGYNYNQHNFPVPNLCSSEGSFGSAFGKDWYEVVND